jgi:hypothetical protein
MGQARRSSCVLATGMRARGRPTASSITLAAEATELLVGRFFIGGYTRGCRPPPGVPFVGGLARPRDACMQCMHGTCIKKNVCMAHTYIYAVYVYLSSVQKLKTILYTHI